MATQEQGSGQTTLDGDRKMMRGPWSLPTASRSENNRLGEERICTYNENIGYVIYSSCGSFYLPLLIILYTYARIILVVKRRNDEFKQVNWYIVNLMLSVCLSGCVCVCVGGWV